MRRAADANGAQSIAAEHKDVVASLLYYLRHDRRPVFSRPTDAVPASQFDLDRPLTPAAPEPVLYLSDSNMPAPVAEYYSTVETLPPIEAPTGPHSVRRLCVFKLSGARRGPVPLKATPR